MVICNDLINKRARIFGRLEEDKPSICQAMSLFLVHATCVRKTDATVRNHYSTLVNNGAAL